MSGQIIGPIGVLPAAGGSSLNLNPANAINVSDNSATTTISGTINLSAGDIVLAVMAANFGALSTCTVTSPSLGTWTARTGVNVSSITYLGAFWAFSASSHASEVVTCTFTNTKSYGQLCLITAQAVTNTGAPFDPNGSIPFYSAAGSGMSLTTTNATTIGVYGERCNSGSITTPAGVTGDLCNTNFFYVGYKKFIAGNAFSVATDVGGSNGTYGDAFT